MRISRLACCVCALALGGLWVGAGWEGPASRPTTAASGLTVPASQPSPAGMDPADPKTWEPAIDQCKAALSPIAKALMAIAKDEKRSNDDRRQAVLLLGKIGSPESLEFLIGNVTMIIPMRNTIGPEDMLKETACVYALGEGGVGDWNVPKAIIQSLRKPKTQEELRCLFMGMTVRGFGPGVNWALLRQQLGNMPEPTYRENLLAMKAMFQEKYGDLSR